MGLWESFRTKKNERRRQSQKGSTWHRSEPSRFTRPRDLQIERFEDRLLLAIDPLGPKLVAAIPNAGDILEENTAEVLYIAPSEILLRFAEGQAIDTSASNLNRIQVTRAGGDGAFGDGKDVNVGIGWIGTSDFPNELIVRFASTLPDDLYQITVGAEFRNGADHAYGETQTRQFRLNLGAQVVAVVPQPITVVSDGPGAHHLEQARNKVEVYFSEDMLGGLSTTDAPVLKKEFYQLIFTNDTADTADDAWKTPDTVAYDRATNKATLTFSDDLYQLQQDAGKSGAVRLRIGNEYRPTETKVLGAQFATDLTGTPVTSGGIVTAMTAPDGTDGAGIVFPDGTTFRVSDGVNTVVFEYDQQDGDPSLIGFSDSNVGVAYNSTDTAAEMATKIAEAINIASLSKGLHVTAQAQGSTVQLSSTDAGSSFYNARNLGKLGIDASGSSVNQSILLSGAILPSDWDREFALPHPGGVDDPAHRDLPNHPGVLIEDHYSTGDSSPDGYVGISTYGYYFPAVIPGSTYDNVITEAQKERAREIFAIYSQYLGVTFYETQSEGIAVCTGDLAAAGLSGFRSERGGVTGVAIGGLALMDNAEDWGSSEFGGDWFKTAMHEIGHNLGFGHSYDAPPGTIMGSNEGGVNPVGTAEPIFPGNIDIVHGTHMYNLDSADIDLYRFEVTAAGTFSAEINAERRDNSSFLDSQLMLYRQTTATENGVSVIKHELVASNDDYYSEDSFLEMYLTPGIYFIGVSSTGNNNYDPSIENSGSGGNTEGEYDLRVNFTPGGVNRDDPRTFIGAVGAAATSIVDANQHVLLDGDADGVPGGVHNFWFNVQDEVNTIFVDKTSTVADPDGSLAKPFKTIPEAFVAASPGTIVRIVGNNFENDRPQIIAIKGSDIIDGQTFTISDELRTVVFEFDVGSNVLNANAVRVPFTATDSAATVAAAIGAAVTTARGSHGLQVTAQVQGINVDLTGPMAEFDCGTTALKTPQQDNVPYAIGRDRLNNNLSDGVKMEIPQGVTVMIDAGAVFKLYGANIAVGSSAEGIDRSGGALQVLGIPGRPVTFTSYYDKTIGKGDDSTQPNPPHAGEWGGLVFRNDADYDNLDHRRVLEQQGIFLNYVNHASLRYGGGQVTVDSVRSTYSPIHMAESRPTVSYNTITHSADAAMSADPNSFAETLFESWNYDTQDLPFTLDYGRVGPEIHGNRVVDNSINGLFVRIRTEAGEPIDEMEVAGRFDDSDIVHVISQNLHISGTPGGAYLEEATAPLVRLSENQIRAVDGGDIEDGDYFSLFDGTTRVVFEFDLDPPSSPTSDGLVRIYYARTDTAATIASAIAQAVNSSALNMNATAAGNVVTIASRGTKLVIDGLGKYIARQDARLVIDPGVIVKLKQSRIEVEMGAQLIAEGRAGSVDGAPASKVVFTSLYDDRYGICGTFDTSNNGGLQQKVKGDWGGIYFSPGSEGSIDHAVIAWAGGATPIEGTFASFSAIEIRQAHVRVANSRLENNADPTDFSNGDRNGRGPAEAATINVRGAQPIIVNNDFLNNGDPHKVGDTTTPNDCAVVSIDVNSLNSFSQTDWGRSTGPADVFKAYADNAGAMVRGNRMDNNGINGMRVRGGTLTTEVVWDDTDIVHVVIDEEIVVPNFIHYGGLRLKSSPDASLIVKLRGDNAGFTAAGDPSDIDDRIGGTVQVLGTPGHPVILTSLADDRVGAGRDLRNRTQFDTNGQYRGTKPAAGDWRSIKLDEYSNDRNVAEILELEQSYGAATDANDDPDTEAQNLGQLAPSETAGDDVLRLGFDVLGQIRTDAPSDVDVYTFKAKPGTEVWFDIDRTSPALDTIIELIDASGKVLARSDDSCQELTDSPNLNQGDLTRSMNRDFWHDKDFYTTNPRDAGMRVVLPGSGTTAVNYYVRVRSSLTINISAGAETADGATFAIRKGSQTVVFEFDTGDGVAAGNHPVIVNSGDPASSVATAIATAINETLGGTANALNKPARIHNGNVVIDDLSLVLLPQTSGLAMSHTSGSYRLQVRLREMQEVAGSSIQYSDVYYATNGIEILGQPSHSPLAAENAEKEAPMRSGANDLRADAEEIGNLLKSNQNAIGVSGYLADRTDIDWYKFELDYDDIQSIPDINDKGSVWATIFDIDYADGMARPDLTMWVFDSAGRLILMSQGSNVSDDRAGDGQGTDLDNLDAGSPGANDPYIGTAYLPEKQTYYVAITSSFARAAVLDDPLTRLEPINSLDRIVEEHIDANNPTSGVDAARLNLTPNEFNLGDVVMYVNTGSDLFTVDPFTGAFETDVSGYAGTSLLPNALGGVTYNDIAMRNDGRLYTLTGRGGAGNQNDIAGQYRRINLEDASLPPITNQPDGIRTYRQKADGSWEENPNGGVEFQAMTHIVTGDGRFVIAVGNAPGINNLLYVLNENGQAFNPEGVSVEMRILFETAPNPPGGLQPTSLGLNYLPRARFELPNNALITGLSYDSTGVLYAVADDGNLYTITNEFGWGFGNNDTPNPKQLDPNGAGPTLTQVGTAAITYENQPIEFSGLTSGPDNVEGGVYKDMLFATDTSGYLYALDTAGNLQPIFRDRETRVQLYGDVNNTAPLSNVRGVTFSPIDYNLWHRTNNRATDAGHGITPAYDSSRVPGQIVTPTPGLTSWYFGLEDPRTGNALDTQPGAANFADRSSDVYQTYDIPGGAYGSLTSDTFSLKGYSPEDLPTLYFNYYAETENSANFDSLRVYVSADGAEWNMLATNTDRDDRDFNDPLVTRFKGVDIIDTDDSWRQARINLSDYAGLDDIRLRFDFSTASTMNVGVNLTTGTYLTATAPTNIKDGDTFTMTNGDKQVTIEFERGYSLLLPNAAGAAIHEGDYFIVSDGKSAVEFEFTKSTPAPSGTATHASISINNTMTAEQVANLVYSAINDSVVATVAPVRDGPRVYLQGAQQVRINEGLQEIELATGTQILEGENYSLVMPSSGGAGIDDHDYFIVGNGTRSIRFEFVKSGPVPPDTTTVRYISITDATTVADLATAVQAAIEDSDLASSVDATIDGSRVYLPGAKQATTNEHLQSMLQVSTGLSDAANYPIAITPDMTIDDVAKAIADRIDLIFSGDTFQTVKATQPTATSAYTTFDLTYKITDPIDVDINLSASAIAIGNLIGDAKPDVVIAVTNDHSISTGIPFVNGATHCVAALAIVDGSKLTGSTAIGDLASNAQLVQYHVPAGLGDLSDTAQLSSLALADMNDDGLTDIVATDSIKKTLVVFLQNNGSFSAHIDTASIGNNPSALVVEDFNGDGIRDVAVANHDDNRVVVLMGRGDGSFGTRSSYIVESGPASIATDDLNGDGKFDLVVGSRGTSTVSVFLGNGNGTFQAASSINVGGSQPTVVVGDVNNDGFADIVTANAGTNSVSVLLGDGAGTFAAQPAIYAAGTSPSAIVLIDYNKDGAVDLAVAGQGTDDVTVLFGDIDTGTGATPGTFTNVTPKVLPVGDGPTIIAAGDIDMNGKTDLVVGNRGSDPGSVTLILQDSQATQTVEPTVQDGQFFTIDDGQNTIVFEMDNDGAVRTGNTSITFTTADDAAAIAQKVADAINVAVLDVRATANGDMIEYEGTNGGNKVYFNPGTTPFDAPEDPNHLYTSCKLDGDLIHLYDTNVSDQGPLGYSGEDVDGLLPGDSPSDKVTRRVYDPANYTQNNRYHLQARGQNNNYEGWYIDDIIIGFAERGEMVTNAGANTNFNPFPPEDPTDPTVVSGSYQLEIRRGEDYGTLYDAPKWLELTNSMDTNDRLAQGFTLLTSPANQIANGDSFTISDGVNSLKFVFLDATLHQGPGTGAVAIYFTSGESAAGIAQKVATAINGQKKIAVTARVLATSNRVDLFDATSVEGIDFIIFGPVDTSGFADADFPQRPIRIVQTVDAADPTAGNTLRDFILGSGITVVGDAIYTGGSVSAHGTPSAGIWTDGVDSGIILTTGDVRNAEGPNNSDSSTGTASGTGDDDLDDEFGLNTSGLTTMDSTSLEFKFRSTGGDLYFEFVFASEEYNEYVNSSFNDVFAFFVDGQNVALIPGTTTPVAINSVNGGNPLGENATNPEFYNNNGPFDGGLYRTLIGYDGFTDVFTAQKTGLSPSIHTIKLVIADVSDLAYDSAVFIKAGSFSDKKQQTQKTYDTTVLPMDTGDRNVQRQQGQVIVNANQVLYSADYGILVEATEADPGPHPGAPRVIGTINQDRLVPGLTIQNNVLAYGELGGISISGSEDDPTAAVPFARIVNNTIYGVKNGDTGIRVLNNASPTLMNNIVAHTTTGISVDATSTSTVIVSTLYQDNGTNLSPSLAQLEPIYLGVSDPLFVNPAPDLDGPFYPNFYLAAGSRAVDSALDVLADRVNIARVKQDMGIPQSPIVAPDLDLFGQLRVDDWQVPSYGGSGLNVFKDRGAIDRADFNGPSSKLIVPMDNDAAGDDANPARNDVRLAGKNLTQFAIQLLDPLGTGIDDSSITADGIAVIPERIKVWRDGTELGNGTDYVVEYDSTNDVIYVIPIDGQWKVGSVYKIQLDNAHICDLAGNTLQPNRTDATTYFTVNVSGMDFGDAPGNYPTTLVEDGARHVIGGPYLGTTEPTSEADARAVDDGDDGVVISSLVLGEEYTVTVTVTGSGYLDGWIDFNGNGVWEESEHILKGEYLTTPTFQRTFDMPADAVAGTTYARFRYASNASEIALPTGLASDGEVEDYAVTIIKERYDYGDGPYNTRLSDDGARHKRVPDLYLGQDNIDLEIDGSPSKDANGDDQTVAGNVDDEDGVTFVSGDPDDLQPGQNVTLKINATVPAHTTAYLYAWLAIRAADGTVTWQPLWEGSPEIPNTADTKLTLDKLMTFTVPDIAVSQDTVIRVRLSDRPLVVGADSQGWATPANASESEIPGGEVEDHHVYLAAGDLTISGHAFADLNGDGVWQRTLADVVSAAPDVVATATGGTPVNYDTPYDFGFDFNFHGVNYSQFAVNSNGTISLLDASGQPTGVILSPFESALETALGTVVLTSDTLASGNSYVQISWVGVVPSGATEANTFSLYIEHSAAGDLVVYDYDRLPSIPIGAKIGYEAGGVFVDFDLPDAVSAGSSARKSIAFRPSDAPTTGTAVVYGRQQYFGFDFDFYGTRYSRFAVNSNGTISLLDTSGRPTGAILSPFESALDTTVGKVVMNSGTRANGKLYVQITWVGVRQTAADSRADTFSLYIEDSDAGDLVVYDYDQMQWRPVEDRVGFRVAASFVDFGPLTPTAAGSTEMLPFAFRTSVTSGEVTGMEPALVNQTIQLDDDDDPTNGVLMTTMTMADNPTTPVNETGYYEFANLAPGTYHVRQVLAAGWNQTLPVDSQYEIELKAGSSVDDIDFGSQHHASVQVDHVAVAEGNSDTTIVEVTLNVSDTYGAPVTLYYETQDGTATLADNDYVEVTDGVITFTPDQHRIATWSKQTLTSNNGNDYDYQAVGNLVVWASSDGHDAEIFLYDGVTTYQLTNNEVDDCYATVVKQGANGWTVVWSQFDGNDYELMAKSYSGAGAFSEIQLTNNSFDDKNAKASADYVTWWGNTSSGSEIFVTKSGATASTVWQLTTNSVPDTDPQISGKYVVWTEGDGATKEIYFWDGAAWNGVSNPAYYVTRLTTNNQIDQAPRIDGNIVVWEGSDGNDTEIFMYKIGTSTAPVQITNDSDGTADVSPQISGNNIVWTRSVAGPGSEIAWYDASSTEGFDESKNLLTHDADRVYATEDNALDAFPQVCGDQVVWHRQHSYGSSDYDVFYYNLKTSYYATNISNGSDNDWYPALSDDYVVWRTYDGNDYEIVIAQEKIVQPQLTLTLEVNGDTYLESDESFFLNLTTAPNSGAYLVDSQGATVSTLKIEINILNDDGSMDYGDAPASYPVTLAQNGARHKIVSGMYLGSRIDAEPNGTPDANATGDDSSALGQDDEDGVVFTSFTTGSVATINVTASKPGELDAWIDFNGDGDWDDPNEKLVFNDYTGLKAGTNELSFTVPVGAMVGTTYARFRYSSAGGLSPTGMAPDGEVEDYQVTILRNTTAVIQNRILTITGSDANDVYSIKSDTQLEIGVNSDTFYFDPRGIDKVVFDGKGGQNKIMVYGNNRDERITASAQSISILRTGLEVIATNIQDVTIDAGDGANEALFTGTAGADAAVAGPRMVVPEKTLPDGTTIPEKVYLNWGLFTSGDTQVFVSNVKTMVFDGAAGNDSASLFGSEGKNILETQMGLITLTDEESSYSIEARNFETLNAYATAGVQDVARLNGTSGTDYFTGNPKFGRLFNSTHSYNVVGFDKVEVDGAGGRDEARLDDSAGDDVFEAKLVNENGNQHYQSTLTYPAAGTLKHYHQLANFESLSVYATTGNDTATLTGTDGDDLFIGTPFEAGLLTGGILNIVHGFDHVTAIAGVGGTDIADLTGFLGADTFTGYENGTNLSRLKDEEGKYYELIAQAFEKVYAHGGGGENKATLFGSDGDDDLVADGDEVITRLDHAHTVAIDDFDKVTAKDSAGTDTKSFRRALDFILDHGEWF